MTEIVDRLAYRAANTFLAVVLLAAALAPAALSLAPDGEGLQWGERRLPNLCFERHRNGQPCPTCRLGRAVVLSAKGQWQASAAQHRAGPLVWWWLAGQAVVRAVLAWKAPRPRRWRLDAGLSALGLGLVWAAARFWG